MCNVCVRIRGLAPGDALSILAEAMESRIGNSHLQAVLDEIIEETDDESTAVATEYETLRRE